MSETRRQIILDTIGDLVSNFLYYDRKEDEDLEVGSIESAIELEEITIEEIIAAFGSELREYLETEADE